MYKEIKCHVCGKTEEVAYQTAIEFFSTTAMEGWQFVDGVSICSECHK